MGRKRNELVPIGEVFSDLDDARHRSGAEPTQRDSS